jgi:hypothetical protein
VPLLFKSTTDGTPGENWDLLHIVVS